MIANLLSIGVTSTSFTKRRVYKEKFTNLYCVSRLNPARKTDCSLNDSKDPKTQHYSKVSRSLEANLDT